MLPVLIPLAFIQYVLDSQALAGEKLRTNGLGKANGIGYYALGALIVLPHALQLGPPAGLAWGVGWLLVASTLVSMAERLAFILRRRSRFPAK